MAEQSPAIDASHPPEPLLKAVNVALRRLLKTSLGSRIGDFMLVNFTGRKSGRQFSIPVSAHQLDGGLYVVLEAQWKYNFRDGAQAEVWHLGKRAAMQGQLITDPAAVVDVVDRVAQSYGAKKAQRSMGMKFRDDRLPSTADWEDAVPRLKIAAIKLTSKA
jgi:hypothetical protein